MRTLTSTALALSFVLASTAAAQATVAGRVAVLERDGKRTTDLENAVLWLEPLEGEAPASQPGTTEIVMESRRYRPAVRVVAPGSSVRFPNYDPFRHNVFSDAGPSRFDLGLYGRGETKDARFAAPGVYPIFCNIHSKMVSFVVAVPSAWRAQAGADGTYQIGDVPAGRYRLNAWHDRGGKQVREIDVAAGAGRVQADVELDARGWRYVAHKNKYGRDYPPETRDRY
jgi:plastocyanin